MKQRLKEAPETWMEARQVWSLMKGAFTAFQHGALQVLRLMEGGDSSTDSRKPARFPHYAMMVLYM
jgi:hypothetical protein